MSAETSALQLSSVSESRWISHHSRHQQSRHHRNKPRPSCTPVTSSQLLHLQWRDIKASSSTTTDPLYTGCWLSDCTEGETDPVAGADASIDTDSAGVRYDTMKCDTLSADTQRIIVTPTAIMYHTDTHVNRVRQQHRLWSSIHDPTPQAQYQPMTQVLRPLSHLSVCWSATHQWDINHTVHQTDTQQHLSSSLLVPVIIKFLTIYVYLYTSQSSVRLCSHLFTRRLWVSRWWQAPVDWRTGAAVCLSDGWCD